MQIYIFTCLTSKKSSIIKTSFDINNFISSKKKSIKDTSIKNILLTNNYTYKLLEEIPKDCCKEKIQKKMYEWQSKLLLQEKQEQIDNEYQKRYEKGKRNELSSKEFIETKFNLSLVSSKYRYSNFDFYDIKKGILVELKSARTKYNYVYCGTTKSMSNDLLIIFLFEDTKKYYYIRYNKELFDTFDTTWIKPPTRRYKNEVFLIPSNLLTELTNEFNVEIKSTEEPLQFNNFIYLDAYKAKCQ